MNYFGHPVINGFRSQTPRGYYDPVKGHTGIDIAAPLGTPLSFGVAVTVADVRVQTQMGNTLYLRTQEGLIVVFAHLSEILVQKGATVPGGTVFAKTGNTGTATTGPHLHLEVIASTPQSGYTMMTRALGLFNGYNVDPEPVLQALLQTQAEPDPHWSAEAFAWAEAQGLISAEHAPYEPITWGQFLVVLKRFSEKD